MQKLDDLIRKFEIDSNRLPSTLKDSMAVLDSVIPGTPIDAELLPHALRVMKGQGGRYHEKACRLALDAAQDPGLSVYDRFQTFFHVGVQARPERDHAKASEIQQAYRAANMVADILDDPRQATTLSAPTRLYGARLVAHVLRATSRGKVANHQIVQILKLDIKRNDIPYSLKAEAVEFLKQESRTSATVSSSRIDSLAAGMAGHPDCAPDDSTVARAMRAGPVIVPFRRPAPAAMRPR